MGILRLTGILALFCTIAFATNSNGACTPATPTLIPTSVPTPTPQPTPEPTPASTTAPAPEPTPAHTPAPTPAPTPEPTPAPTPAPTPEPTPAPTPAPTHTPSPPTLVANEIRLVAAQDNWLCVVSANFDELKCTNPKSTPFEWVSLELMDSNGGNFVINELHMKNDLLVVHAGNSNGNVLLLYQVGEATPKVLPLSIYSIGDGLVTDGNIVCYQMDTNDIYCGLANASSASEFHHVGKVSIQSATISGINFYFINAYCQLHVASIPTEENGWSMEQITQITQLTNPNPFCTLATSSNKICARVGDTKCTSFPVVKSQSWDTYSINSKSGIAVSDSFLFGITDHTYTLYMISF